MSNGGGATLLILICHAYGNDVLMPSWLTILSNNAQIGVDVFLFISGIGIAYSLSKVQETEGQIKLTNWYLKRLKRIYVPFLLLSIPYCLYKILFEDWSVADGILYIANLGFLINGRGAWYVSLILLAYLLSPFLYRLLYRGRYKWHLLAALCILITFVCQDAYYDSMFYVSNACKRLPSFMIGMAIAEKVKEGKHVSVLPLSLISISVYLITTILFRGVFCKWMVIVPITLIMCNVIEKFKCLNKICVWFGVISLESYLTNIQFGDILNHKSWIICGIDLSYGHYLEYSAVLIIGIMVAYFAHSVSNKILKSNDKI